MSNYITTPKTITSEIRKLCEKVLPGSTPEYVEVIPTPEALPSECFPNVEQHVEKHGGKSIIGWQVWEWPGVFAEAEFHAVWQRPDETLVDITPKISGESSILFIPDRTRQYTGSRVPNIKHPIAKGEIVRDYIKLLDIGFDVVEHYSVRGNTALTHYGRMLEDSLDLVKAMLIKGRTTKGKCVCGGHLPYGDCHRFDVKDAIAALTKLAVDLKQ